MKLLRINEESRYNDSSMRETIKSFIEANRNIIDELASQDNWEEIYSMLEENFGEDDLEEVRTIFNQEYGDKVEENEEEEDEEMDHRNTSRVKGMPYSARAKSAIGVNQKLTESSKSLLRLKDF
jgi:hypothetical protein